MSRKFSRPLLFRSVPQLGSNDDACTNLALTDLRNMPRNWTVRMPYELRRDIRVQQVPHQISTAPGGASEIGGKSSSIGERASSTFKRDLGEAGSIISHYPSLRIKASSPGSSNSREILTAWFRPFLKSLTCRSVTGTDLLDICLSICWLCTDVKLDQLQV